MTPQEILTDIHSLEEELLDFERKYGVRSEIFYAAYASGEEPQEEGWVLDFGGWSEVGEIMQYMVVIEKGPTSYGAHVPDLPGCIAVGQSHDEVLNLIREAIVFHIEGLKEQGLPVPEPCSTGEIVEVLAA